MTELISPRESAYMFTIVSVVLVLVVLLVLQTYRSRQISQLTMRAIIGAIVTGVAIVLLLFLEYAVPHPRNDDYIPRKRRPMPESAVRERQAMLKTTTPRNYVCYRTEHPPAIDGQLNDQAWLDVPWSESFVDICGADGPVPRFQTRMKMVWDNTHLYVGAELEEPHVWATVTQRNDVIFQDNDFEVFIDPDGDNHNYYELEINALNTIWELTLIKPYRDGGPPIHGTNMEGLQTGVFVAGAINDPSRNDRGWSVELAFPWRGFDRYTEQPLPPADGDTWRMNFSRVEWQHTVTNGVYAKVPDTREDNWVWSPQGAVNMHRPERWGFVQFSTESLKADPFRPDTTLPVRELLMDVYYRQRNFRETHKRWAASLEELGLRREAPGSARAQLAAMTAGPAGFKATGILVQFDGKVITMHVNQDSRLWSE